MLHVERNSNDELDQKVWMEIKRLWQRLDVNLLYGEHFLTRCYGRQLARPVMSGKAAGHVFMPPPQRARHATLHVEHD